jgi:hypothetical protein
MDQAPHETTDAIHPDHRHTSNRGSVRADLARNAALLVVLWIAYAIVRGITAGDLAAATENARWIIDVERALGLPSEAGLQSMLIDQQWLLKSANLYYLGVHFPVTVGFLAWAWRNHRSEFARVRNALIATTSAGLVIHVLYPLKPPRMMNGFVDTGALLGPDPYSLGISGGANQLAAMPSLHVGWALLIAIGTIWIGTSRAKWLALAHPCLTLFAVVLTANHFWVDAIAATAIVIAAWHFTPTRRSRTSGRPSTASPPALDPRRTQSLRVRHRINRVA